MLRRLRALQGAAPAAAPALVEPGLYLGDAVCADAHHVLRHLGVTHVVNATQVCAHRG
jgi:atypical dual specificity phosphatase